MRNYNDNNEHLVQIVRDEMKQEHLRECRILAGPKDQKRVIESKVWSERLDAADRIIQTLCIYKLSSAAEEADSYVYLLRKWKAANNHQSQVVTNDDNSSAHTNNTDTSSRNIRSIKSLASSQVDSATTLNHEPIDYDSEASFYFSELQQQVVDGSFKYEQHFKYVLQAL
jgi:hypothetical protein